MIIIVIVSFLCTFDLSLLFILTAFGSKQRQDTIDADYGKKHPITYIIYKYLHTSSISDN